MNRFDSDDAYFALILVAVAVFVFFSLLYSPRFPQPEVSGESAGQTVSLEHAK